MAVSSVSFGSNPTQATVAKKRMDPVKKGAIIAGSIVTVGNAAGSVALSGLAKKSGMTFGEFLKTSYGNAGKYAALVAASIALYTAVGAGIGKLVKNHQAKKAEKADSTKVFTTQA